MAAPPPGEPPSPDVDEQGRPWSSLMPGEQLKLREAYGRYLDDLPPTCDLDTKVARFASWLRGRGILFEG